MAQESLLPVPYKRRPSKKSIFWSALYFLMLIALLLIFCPWTIGLVIAIGTLVFIFLLGLGLFLFTSFSLIILLPVALLLLFFVVSISVALLPLEILGSFF